MKHSLTIGKTTTIIAALTALLRVGGADGAPLHVERGALYEGNSGIRFQAIQQPGLGNPNISREDFDRAFIKVSNVGAFNVCFSLDGFSEDGTSWDSAYRDQALRVIREANGRWMDTVVRVLGELQDAPHETRLNAVRTAARELRDQDEVLFWIDGPRSGELAKAFRKKAGKLVVVSEEGGQMKAITHPYDAVPGVPSVLIGSMAYPSDRIAHCIMPDEPETYLAFERKNRERIELQPWESSEQGLSEEEKAEGFVSLFDGKSFDGWAKTGWNKDGFVVEDGAIVWKARGVGSVQSRKRYSDFVLRLEFNIHEEGGNSGIFLRAPRENRESRMGMEFQINGDYELAPHKNGTGSIYDVVSPMVNAVRPAGEWNDLEIMMDGPKIRITLNGLLVQDISMNDFEMLQYRNREGFIALQDHDDPVSFRRIRIKEL